MSPQEGTANRFAITLFRRAADESEAPWHHLDGFDALPGSVPRIGETIKHHGKFWRVVDVIWDFTAQPPDASVGHLVELHLEPSSE